MYGFSFANRTKALSLFAVVAATCGLQTTTALAGDHHHRHVGFALEIGRPGYVEQSRVVVIEPARYETRVQKVWVEPVYRDETVETPIPAVYETRTRREWVPAVTQARRTRVIVPAVYEDRRVEVRRHHRSVWITQRVLITPEHTEIREQTVVIAPGHWRDINEKVCVRPASMRRERRQVCVTPGHWTSVAQRVCVQPARRQTVVEQVPVDSRGFFLGVGVGKHHHRGVNVEVGVRH